MAQIPNNQVTTDSLPSKSFETAGQLAWVRVTLPKSMMLSKRFWMDKELRMSYCCARDAANDHAPSAEPVGLVGSLDIKLLTKVRYSFFVSTQEFPHGEILLYSARRQN